MGWRGFNCSLPHKVAIISHLDGLGESAATMGAVNCVVRRGDKFIGENTDGVGFMESLRTLVDVKDKSLVVFGAGGAARAIAVEAALAGARRLTIVNRSFARGAELAELINAKTPARAEVRPLGQNFSRRRRGRRFCQRDVDRPLSRCRRPARRRSFRRPTRSRRRRRHPQSAAHPVHSRGRSPRPSERSTGSACWSTRASSRSATGSASTSRRAVMRRTLEELFRGVGADKIKPPRSANRTTGA